MKRIAWLVMFAACGRHGVANERKAAEIQIAIDDAGLDGEEIERAGVVQMERAMSTLPHLTRIRSLSEAGHAIVALKFSPLTDPDLSTTRLDVVERLSLPSLPGSMTANLNSATSRDGVILRYTLRSDQTPLPDVRRWQDWVARRKLTSLPGISEVT